MFCQNCGTNVGDAAFCSKCGTKMAGDGPAPNGGGDGQPYAPSLLEEEVVIWEGQPASIGDKAKFFLNDTKYILTNQRLIIKTGLLNKKEQEINLKDIKDYRVKKNLGEMVQGVGDISIISEDPTTETAELSNIQDPDDVKELLRKAVLDYKRAINIRYHD